MTSALNTASGSPPHVRGKDQTENQANWYAGITPACAGKRYILYFSHDFAWDHPRMCGGKALGLAPADTSPAMCGKERSAYYFACFGDHPACAGVCFVGIRMCGEHLFKYRGICAWDHPACAGKRLKRSRSTVPPVAIVPLFPSVCNKPVVSDGSPAGRDAPLFLPAENAVPASPAYNLRSL